MGAQIAVAEPVGQQAEDDQGGEECLGAARVDRQGRYPRAGVGDGGAGQGVDGVGADGGVVAETLDGQQPSVGVEADLPQCGQVTQSLADAEVATVVDGCLGP